MDQVMNFTDKEKVLCFHGPLMYEAKVLKAEYWKDRKDLPDGPYYFVHYNGWKASWDEWVPESRMMKINEENLAKQSQLKSGSSGQKKKAAVSAKPAVDPVAAAAAKEKKRRRESMLEKEDEYVKKPEIKISIPESLKSQLVEDWENVTKNHKLLPVPAPIAVSQFLEKFYAGHQESTKKTRREGVNEDSMKQVVEGLKVYFDKALGNILLYKLERTQYVEIVKSHPATRMSDLYGPEHLLRLFVQLPSLIAHTNMTQDAVNILKDHFSTILLYMQKNQSDIFCAEYESSAGLASAISRENS